MKNYKTKILLIILSFCLTIKGIAQPKSDSLTTKLTKEKIIAHIKTRMGKNKPLRNAKINKVIENMQFENMYIESPGSEAKLLIIPMNKVYFSQNIDSNKPKPLQYVLIFEREKEEISRADFLIVYPTNKNLTKMPKNAFYDFYRQNSTQIDGTYTFINFGDVKQFEMYIKNGEREKIIGWQSKSNFKNTGSNDCTDWSLDTDYYNKDQTVTTTKQNLGKTCTECPPGFKCDPIKK
jgi:hypothetical protein